MTYVPEPFPPQPDDRPDNPPRSPEWLERVEVARPPAPRYWRVTARVVTVEGSWRRSWGVPTFYLDRYDTGQLDGAGVEGVARRMLADLVPGAEVHVQAAPLEAPIEAY